MNKDIHVLVADDDPEILFATARIVERDGYTVSKASSGTQCLDLVNTVKPDLVLLDVILPDIEGTEVCRQLKSDPALQGIFIILLSGMKTSSAEQADGLDYGADGYIARPVSNRELLARVNASVRIIRAENARDRLISELQEAMAKIKTLSGLLPICSHCKKIRDDRGYWNQIDSYIQQHTDADFSHSICPGCAREHYPDLDLYDD